MNLLHRCLAYLGCLTAVIACGDNLAPIEPTKELPTDETLYSDDRIWDVHIELGFEEIAELNREPREYVPATVTVGGIVFPNAGVHLKGTFSFRPLSDKAAFKIRLDKFVDGQSLGQIHRMTLNNMWQSRGMVSEWIAYQVFAAAGVPAPRAGYVQVWVNGDLYGLYANIETEDQYFLARHFADNTGNLYEAALTDLSTEELADYEQERGDDLSRDDLTELVAAVEDASDGLFFDDPPLLHSDEFWGFAAAEAWTGHWDGYWKAHNYRLYADPSTGRWSFLPWGTDMTFERRLDPFSGAGLLTQKCLGSDRCLLEQTRRGRELALAVEDLDLPRRLDDLIAVIDEAMENDPRKAYGADKIRRHQRGIRDYLQEQSVFVAQRFACTDEEGELDQDGDGFGACLADCDDSSNQAHPGGSEICDGLDNDCNGIIDELVDCGCQEETVSGRQFLFCRHPMPWTRAASHCQAQGGQLAAITGAAESTAVHTMAQSIRGDHWYFGANDRQEEGQWMVGDEPAADNWGSDEPDGFGNEDCAIVDRYGGGQWADVQCQFAHPFICELPGD